MRLEDITAHILDKTEEEFTEEIFDLRKRRASSIASKPKIKSSKARTERMAKKRDGLSILQNMDPAEAIKLVAESMGVKPPPDLQLPTPDKRVRANNRSKTQRAKANVDPAHQKAIATYRQTLVDSLVVGSSKQGMSEIPNHCIHGVWLDDQRFHDPDKMVAVLTECKRLLTSHGRIIYWLPLLPALPYALQKAAQEVGLNFDPFPYIYELTPEIPNTQLNAVSYESFFVLSPTDFSVIQPRSRIQPFIPQFARVDGEKTIQLVTHVLSSLLRTGSNVVIPFAGTGRPLLAAANLSMKPVGWTDNAGYEAYIAQVYSTHPGKYTTI